MQHNCIVFGIDPFSCSRNGVVRFESVIKMRDKLEKDGIRKGVNRDEKGDPSPALHTL